MTANYPEIIEARLKSFDSLQYIVETQTSESLSIYSIQELTSKQCRVKQESVRPRWPYDMRPSARAEKYMCVIVIR